MKTNGATGSNSLLTVLGYFVDRREAENKYREHMCMAPSESVPCHGFDKDAGDENNQLDEDASVQKKPPTLVRKTIRDETGQLNMIARDNDRLRDIAEDYNLDKQALVKLNKGFIYAVRLDSKLFEGTRVRVPESVVVPDVNHNENSSSGRISPHKTPSTLSDTNNPLKSEISGTARVWGWAPCGIRSQPIYNNPRLTGKTRGNIEAGSVFSFSGIEMQKTKDYQNIQKC